MLKLRLQSGAIVKSPSQSYTVEVWENCKWNIVKVFSPEKWTDAEKYYKKARKKFTDVRLQQWY